MSNLLKIASKFRKNETVYLLNDFEEIVIKLIPISKDYRCIAKFKDKSKEDEYELSRTTNLVSETEMSGKIITKKEYDEY